jgi:hypothetical protein
VKSGTTACVFDDRPLIHVQFPVDSNTGTDWTSSYCYLLSNSSYCYLLNNKSCRRVRTGESDCVVCSPVARPWTQYLQWLHVCAHVCMLYYIRTAYTGCPRRNVARLREGIPYVKVYRYNPKHPCPKLNGYGDNGQRKVWFSGGSTHCTCQLTVLSMSILECGVTLRQFSSRQP